MGLPVLFGQTLDHCLWRSYYHVTSNCTKISFTMNGEKLVAPDDGMLSWRQEQASGSLREDSIVWFSRTESISPCAGFSHYICQFYRGYHT